MKLFGKLSELVALWMKADGEDIKVTPNTSTAYTAARTYELPNADANDELAGLVASQTLTNKTLDADNNTVSNLEHGAEVDEPSSGVHGVAGDIVGTSDAQTLTNKTIDADSSTITNIKNDEVGAAAAIAVNKLAALTANKATVTGATGFLESVAGVTKAQIGYLSGLGGTITTGGAWTQTGAHTLGITTTANTLLTVPTSGTVTTKDSTDVLTNKSIDSDNNTITNIVDADIKAAAAIAVDKIAALTASKAVVTGAGGFLESVAGVTAAQIAYLSGLGGTLTTLGAWTQTGAHTLGITTTGNTAITLPTSGTVSTLAGSEELSNKTLTSPTINTGDVGTELSFLNQGEIRLLEQTGNGSHYVGFEAPDAVTSDCIWKLPDGDGNANELLVTDGSKNLSFAAGASAALADGNVDIGNGSNVRTAVNTDLLGDVQASYGSNTVTFDFTGGAAEDIVLWTGHTLSVGDTVYFTTTGALPAEISASTTYYVVTDSANYFQISATRGGAILEFTDDGSATTTVFFGGLRLRADTQPNSMIRLNTSNGRGSGSTKIRRFTNITSSQGSAITYTTSADTSVLGSVFTINEAGIYAIHLCDVFDAGGLTGITLNSSQLTTAISSAGLTIATRLSIAQTAAANAPVACSWTGILNAGDVIRAHCDGNNDSAQNYRANFTITQCFPTG